MAKPVVIPAARAKLVQVFGGDIYLTMPSDEAGTGLKQRFQRRFRLGQRRFRLGGMFGTAPCA